MNVKIVYDESNQPVEAIIPYPIFKALEKQIMSEDQLLDSGRWPDPDLEKVRERLARLNLEDVGAALQKEREDSR